MKIVNSGHVVPATVRAEIIPIGSVFTGKIGVHEGAFLRTHDGVVHLDEPINTWGKDACISELRYYEATLYLAPKEWDLNE